MIGKASSQHSSAAPLYNLSIHLSLEVRVVNLQLAALLAEAHAFNLARLDGVDELAVAPLVALRQLVVAAALDRRGALGAARELHRGLGLLLGLRLCVALGRRVVVCCVGNAGRAH